jgi:hypothetical protein
VAWRSPSFDCFFDTIKAQYDIGDQDLSSLIEFVFEHGVLSNNRRKQYGQRVPQGTLDAIEICAKACLAQRQAHQRPSAGPLRNG